MYINIVDFSSVYCGTNHRSILIPFLTAGASQPWRRVKCVWVLCAEFGVRFLLGDKQEANFGGVMSA